MEIIYGTRNAAKLSSMRVCLSRLKPECDIDVVGLDEIGAATPDVDEDGNDPLENARKKASAYYSALKRPVFSVDSGLYFDGLPDELQPGLFIRRVGGKRLTDDGMIEYYANLAAEHGGTLTARYVNGICLIMNESLIYEHTGDDIATCRFIMCSKPHSRRVEGFPLDSLSLHIGSGAYFYDRPGTRFDKEMVYSTDEGFRGFFKAAYNDYVTMR